MSAALDRSKPADPTGDAMVFDEVITDTERLRDFYNQPSHRVTNKALDHLDPICRTFIGLSSFVMIGTRGRDGLIDLSPKGDPAGFVRVLDDKTFAIPDRMGNNRLDTLENLMVHPEIAVSFFITGTGHSLRVSGRGRVVRDAALQDRMGMNGRPSGLLTVVTVEEVFLHCTKCMVRSGMWKPETWPDPALAPALAESMIVHGSLTETREEIDAILVNDTANRLY